jgi:hypothetical protein
MSFSLMACADNNSSELHTKFVDADVQDKFTARLSSEGIPYRQTADGTVWYPAKEYDRVERISQEIVKSDYRGYTIHYDNPEHVRLFREKLTLQDIPFQARVRGNKELTSWNAADDSKVQNIIIEVRKIIIEERKAEILEKRRNN